MNAEIAKHAVHVSKILKQLSHPDRLRVLCALSDGESTVGQLAESIGASQSWVSQFLTKMKSNQLVDSRKEGLFVYYRIRDVRLRKLMKVLYTTYCSEE